MNKTLSGRLRELKNKRKNSIWVIPKVGAVAYSSGRFTTAAFHYKVQVAVFTRGYTKVVVTRAGCLREWVARRASTAVCYSRNLIYRTSMLSVLINAKHPK